MASLDLSALKNISASREKRDEESPKVAESIISTSPVEMEKEKPASTPKIQKISLTKLRKENENNASGLTKKEAEAPKPEEIKPIVEKEVSAPKISINAGLKSEAPAITTPKNEEVSAPIQAESIKIEESTSESVSIMEESLTIEETPSVEETSQKTKETTTLAEMPKEFFPGLNTVDDFDFGDGDLLKLENESGIIQSVSENTKPSLAEQKTETVKAVRTEEVPNKIEESVVAEAPRVETLVIEPVAIKEEPITETMSLESESSQTENPKPSPEYVTKVKQMLSLKREGGMKLLAKKKIVFTALGITTLLFAWVLLMTGPLASVEPQGKANVMETLPPSPPEPMDMPEPIEETTPDAPLPTPTEEEIAASTGNIIAPTSQDYTAWRDYTVIKNTKKNRRIEK